MRVARGKRGATWESAVTGLPLETGFNLVTGAGRAEIEFEDASTVYLAENSALTFNDLHTTGGVPTPTWHFSQDSNPGCPRYHRRRIVLSGYAHAPHPRDLPQ